jgi:hypothetical protein
MGQDQRVPRAYTFRCLSPTHLGPQEQALGQETQFLHWSFPNGCVQDPPNSRFNRLGQGRNLFTNSSRHDGYPILSQVALGVEGNIASRQANGSGRSTEGIDPREVDARQVPFAV